MATKNRVVNLNPPASSTGPKPEPRGIVPLSVPVIPVPDPNLPAPKAPPTTGTRNLPR